MTTGRGYETFDHTADIGIRAWGNEFSEVFEEAAKALFSVIVDLDTVTPRQTLSFELASESGEELFLKWLKELLFIFETKHLVFKQFNVRLSPPSPQPSPQRGEGDHCFPSPSGRGKGEGFALAAEISGEPLDNAKHSLGREVKAITLHQFKLAKEKARYFTEAILDI